MIQSLNVIRLPRTCFAVVLDNYFCHDTELELKKLVFNTIENEKIIGNKIELPTESIVKDKNKNLYVNLDVKKNLLIDAKLFSGKVQALTCDYYIFSHQDSQKYFLQKVKDVLRYNFTDCYFKKTVEILENALEFDLISENDYVQMTYTDMRVSWKESKTQWNIFTSHDLNKVIKVYGMMTPSNKNTLDLKQVLRYSNNRGITQTESDKIKKLLQTTDSEKLALTLLNTINPDNSFVELMCLINHMEDNIKKRNINVPVLPLMKGAYNIETQIKRFSDNIVDSYKLHFGYPTDDVLERIADNYYHPYLENSSVFKFKLKRK
jgi:hypothetical protein